MYPTRGLPVAPILPHPHPVYGPPPGYPPHPYNNPYLREPGFQRTAPLENHGTHYHVPDQYDPQKHTVVDKTKLDEILAELKSLKEEKKAALQSPVIMHQHPPIYAQPAPQVTYGQPAPIYHYPTHEVALASKEQSSHDHGDSRYQCSSCSHQQVPRYIVGKK